MKKERGTEELGSRCIRERVAIARDLRHPAQMFAARSAVPYQPKEVCIAKGSGIPPISHGTRAFLPSFQYFGTVQSSDRRASRPYMAGS